MSEAIEPTSAYRPRQESLSWREVDGETVLLDETDWTYLHLNDTGAAVWARLASGATVDQLADALVEAFDVDRTTALSDVIELMEALAERALIEPA